MARKKPLHHSLSVEERTAPAETEEQIRVQENEARRLTNIRFSPAEVERQMAAVRELMLRGHGFKVITRHMRLAFSVGEARTRKLMQRVQDAWLSRAADDKQYYRSWTEARLLAVIAQLHGERNKPEDWPKLGEWKVRPNWSALIRFEELLAKIQGTIQPVKVDVNLTVNAAVHHVFYDLTPEQIAEMDQKALEDERLAAEYKQLTRHEEEPKDPPDEPS
jgi:hypothetical protein